MDEMMQSYIEETEDLLQRAEECMIHLETQYSTTDINELFRIAHTIKGSSHMVGYEDIGNVMHKIEDMLDGVRNQLLEFSQKVITLCFTGIDIVKKLLKGKNEPAIEQGQINEEARNIVEEINEHILSQKRNVTTGKNSSTSLEVNLIKNLYNQSKQGKHKYFIVFTIEEDAPMVSPVFMLIIQTIRDLGTLLYSSVSDQFFQSLDENETRTLEVLISTDMKESELYTYFSLFYVEKINITQLCIDKMSVRDYYFQSKDQLFYHQLFYVVLILYSVSKGSAKGLTKKKKEQLREKCNSILDLYQKTSHSIGISAYIDEIKTLSSQLLESFINTKTKKTDNHMFINRCNDIIDKLQQYIQGRYIVCSYHLREEEFQSDMNHFLNLMDKSNTYIFLVVFDGIQSLNAEGVKHLLKLIKDMEEEGIELALIVDGANQRPIINIFDAIRPLYNLSIYSTELEAIHGILQNPKSYEQIMNRVKNIIRP